MNTLILNRFVALGLPYRRVWRDELVEIKDTKLYDARLVDTPVVVFPKPGSEMVEVVVMSKRSDMTYATGARDCKLIAYTKHYPRMIGYDLDIQSMPVYTFLFSHHVNTQTYNEDLQAFVDTLRDKYPFLTKG